MQDNELLAAFRHYQNLASNLAALYQMKLIGYDEHQRQLGALVREFHKKRMEIYAKKSLDASAR